jgi:UDP-3-O-[3-hydroxymyristoyl] N-acetylglucosamine deacetylase / 3-hydroxyacyl-[acyl-carrier-protein] dehydratase
LIKGGDLENAVVILEREVEQEEIDRIAKIFNKPGITEHHAGVLNNTKLRYPNEPARHKLLDLIGDLSLVGQPIKGKVVATRPGHYSNTRLARLIRQQIKRQTTKKEIPLLDTTKPAAMDIQQIKKLLPHRFPFLMVDRILEVTKNHVIGIKNTTYNEAFFQGHFEQEHVFPGVLLVETMAQVGGILVLSNVDDPERYSTYFLKIDRMKFKHKVIPGDTIVVRADLTEPIRRSIVIMYCQAFVGEKLVAEGEMTAQVIKNK